MHVFSNSKKTIALLLSFMLLTTGCVVESISGTADSGSVEPPPGGGGVSPGDFVYDGCVDGQGVGTKSILINFLFPNKAAKVRIKRNGILVAEFSKENAVTSHVDDNGLREGATYLYTCEALIDGLWAEGKRDLSLSTLAVNAPEFTGIDSAEVKSPNSVLVKWTPSISDEPVSAYSYKIYANIGDEVDWATTSPRATVLQGDPAEILIDGLGDELSYAFGVRACSEGDVCETNVKKEVVVTTDGGAPTSPGATALAVVNGKLQVTAPWQESHGGIVRRYVYVRKGSTGGTNIGDYTLERTYILSGDQLFSPPTTLEVSPLEEGETYNIIVQDQDPSGQRAQVSRFESITIQDITPPSFGGITNIANENPTDSTIRVSWTAIETEANDPVNGGSIYRILSLASTTPIAANPCTQGNQVTDLDVSSYTAGSAANYNITGLVERTYYKICIKALDSSGNVSTNNNSLQINTKDITAPNFSGIQSLVFDNQTASLKLSWNTSTSGDIKEYVVELWKNQQSPPANPTRIVRSHEEAATGTSITQSDFAVNDNDQVYVRVEACDKTEPPFGSQNCSNTGLVKSIVAPDVTPPQNFLGIKGPTEIETPTEGAFVVKWNTPSDWSDYRGFRVYQVNPQTDSLTLLKTCPCADYGCSDEITQCAVSGLDPYRTYRLHVRAYDNKNNETLYLDPATNYSDKRTSDTTEPSFASNLTVGVSPTFVLNWAGGVDNQYSNEPGAVVTYEVYQNIQPFDFSDPSQPDGNLKASITNKTFQDSGFEEGQTYYYTVCAKDASGNKNCDQLTRYFTVPDVTVPQITKLRSTKTIKGKVWELNWDMSDNITSSENIYVEIRSKISTNGDLATPSDQVIYTGLGSDLKVSEDSMSTAQSASLDPLSGTPNVNRKINYLVTVRDEEGNSSSSNVTVSFTNQMTVTSVKSNVGPLAGNKRVAVYGTGFSSALNNEIGEGTTVTISGKTCQDVEILSDNALVCTTPGAAAPGSVEVRVRQKINKPSSASNNMYSTVALTNGYTYSSTVQLCDNPGAWGTNFAAGTGVSTDPYIICNASHLDSIRSIFSSGSYYKLGAMIDLEGASFSPIGSSTQKFTGNFDGAGFLIMNWTYNSTTKLGVGLFAHIIGDFQVANLGLVNIDISGKQSVGGLAGIVEGGVNKTGLISNVFVTGQVAAEDYAGGLIGRKQNDHTNFNIIKSYFVGGLQVTGSSGFGGGIMGLVDGVGGNFQDLYSEGTISGSRLLGGLFGRLSNGKSLNKSFSRMTISATDGDVGGLVGDLTGSSITESYVESATLQAKDNIGGLVGSLNGGTVQNSYAAVDVASTGRGSGGVVGISKNGGQIENVESQGKLTLTNEAGGIVGNLNNSTLINARVESGLSSPGTDVGGVVGRVSGANSVTISKVYSRGLLDVTGSGIGGVIGNVGVVAGAVVNISEVFSESQLGTDFTLTNQQYGGVIGKINAATDSEVYIDNCFSSGDIFGGAQVGGLVGGYDIVGGAVNINDCYSSSFVAGSNTSRGGLFGKSDSTLITVNNSYWDTETSTRDFPVGIGDYSGNDVTGYSTQEMQDYNNSIYTDWDFTNVWLVPAQGYPQFQFVN